MDEFVDDTGAVPGYSVGTQLQRARTDLGLDLNDIATRTRIPLRHLDAIERDDFAALPSPTYALGFVRAYARAVDLPETPLVDAVRAAMGRSNPAQVRVAESYQPADPARVPGRWLVWATLVLAALALGGYALWRAQWFDGGNAPIVAEQADPSAGVPPELGPDNAAAPAAATPAAAQGPGQVRLTAKETVWLQVRDGGRTLYQGELAQGATYDVPLTAAAPVIRTGAPERVDVTIDGQAAAALGPAATLIKNVPVSATALRSRATTPGATAAGQAPGLAPLPADAVPPPPPATGAPGAR